MATKPSGDGTEANPYKIETKEQLYWFAELVNGTLNGVQQNTSAWAELTTDITINENVLDENGNLTSDVSGLEAWTPIGSYGDKGDKAYTGTFNGKGHTISGLYINDSDADYVGLFGYVGEFGKIQNVGVKDSYISGGSYVGGVCGYNFFTGFITSCYNTGDVSGSDYVGGVCGYNNGGIIENCYNTGDVSGDNSAGGVCGYNFLGGFITSCYNTGEVSGSNSVGGVCGWNSDGTIENCWNTGSVSGDENVGGVCGWNDNTGTIENCYNTGDVSGNNNMGGVCGVNGGTIENCYNTGNVSGNNNMGGVCGASYGGTIENCHNTGDVSGSDYVGGVCGYNEGSTITNCYNTGEVSGSDYVGGVCGHSFSGSTIGNSYNTGKVTGSGGHSIVGGVCGYSFSGSTIENSYNTGEVTGSGGHSIVGGVCGASYGGTIENCYNTGEVSGSDYVGGVCGYSFSGSTIENCYFLSGTANQGVGSGSGTANKVEKKEDTVFASGEVAWLLNDGQTDQTEKPWGQGSNNVPVLISNLPKGVIYKAPVRISIVLPQGDEQQYGYTTAGSALNISLYPYPTGYVFFEDSTYATLINDISKKTYNSDTIIYAALPVTGITLNKTELSLYVGGEETLTATVLPADAYNTQVTWSSIDSAVATVDSSGKVTAVKAGTAIITATAADGQGAKAECTVTVIQPVTGVSLNKTELSLYVGGEETLTATVSPDTASQNLTWSSSDNTVATVDSGGKVTAVKAGTAIITATASDGSGLEAQCTVTVRKKSSSSSTPAKYNLRFDTNGGDTMSTIVKKVNTTIDLDEYVPTREGYKFVGWYADEDLTKPIDEITLTQSTTIYAKWEKIEEEEQEETTEQEETAVSFTDVRESDWFYKAVSYAVENSLMSGMGDGTFSPNTPLQREMFATVLWNLEGNPAPKDVAPFLDVTSDKYYADAIAWASENGIVAGFGDTFGVGVPITREQFAVMLHNYARYKGYDVSVGEDTNILSYADAFDISDYAYPAMQWACGAGIINGMGDGTLVPQGQTTRAETATILMNFCENVVK